MQHRNTVQYDPTVQCYCSTTSPATPRLQQYGRCCTLDLSSSRLSLLVRVIATTISLPLLVLHRTEGQCLRVESAANSCSRLLLTRPLTSYVTTYPDWRPLRNLRNNEHCWVSTEERLYLSRGCKIFLIQVDLLDPIHDHISMVKPLHDPPLLNYRTVYPSAYLILHTPTKEAKHPTVNPKKEPRGLRHSPQNIVHLLCLFFPSHDGPRIAPVIFHLHAMQHKVELHTAVTLQEPHQNCPVPDDIALAFHQKLGDTSVPSLPSHHRMW